MYRCPHCGEKCINGWQKYWATRFFPTKCQNCHGRSYIPTKYGNHIYLLMLLPALLIWSGVFFFKSATPLIAFAPLFVWAHYLYVTKAPLITK